mmetsp:Transcript_15501/g.33058  ORF Transcript_15501/g.33058 Transcript_15501/m.33058 type:complete len:212 (-) Transcript_15501:2-637(-)
MVVNRLQELLVHRLAEAADGLTADHILRAANKRLRHVKTLESLLEADAPKGSIEEVQARQLVRHPPRKIRSPNTVPVGKHGHILRRVRSQELEVHRMLVMPSGLVTVEEDDNFWQCVVEVHDPLEPRPRFTYVSRAVKSDLVLRKVFQPVQLLGMGKVVDHGKTIAPQVRRPQSCGRPQQCVENPRGTRRHGKLIKACTPDWSTCAGPERL